MQTSTTFDAIVEIAELRNRAVEARDKAYNEGLKLAWFQAIGEAAAYTKALDLLREAGEHVASAEYLAVHAGTLQAHP